MRLDADPLKEYPRPLIEKLADLGRQCGGGIYVTGGAVRDWQLGRHSLDLDITVEGDAVGLARHYARSLGAAFVLLDEQEQVARVVWGAHGIDFAGLRRGARTIHEDLCRRDFTINALAVEFDSITAALSASREILDPTGGCRDLAKGLIRATSERVFDDDPLRLLRAYRFKATLGFAVTPETAAAVAGKHRLLAGVAAERVAYELGRIMDSQRAGEVFHALAENSLLWIIFPELQRGVGLAQPSSHHLDVCGHSLAALDAMEQLIRQPERYFGRRADEVRRYLDRPPRPRRLKWAALLHDIGKPPAHEIKDSRITFYNHDKIGAKMFEALADRLRWSRDEKRQVGLLIAHHMWPFHLSNVARHGLVTPRACLRLIKAVDDELAGLFLLAMADSLAGMGQGKPPEMEENLSLLFDQVIDIYLDSIKPVLTQPRLLSGHDLKEIFGLVPGPLFKRIFAEIEQAQVAGRVRSRSEAVQLVTELLAGQPGKP